MFVVGAIVILIVSFTIAFVSLFRGQRRLKGELERTSGGTLPAGAVAPEPAPEAKLAVEPPPQPPPEVEKEPFPWETSQSEEIKPVATQEVTGAQVPDENFILHPKRASSNLGTTVTLRDLANKNKS